MVIDGATFMTDSVALFFDTLTVLGWFHHPTIRLSTISVGGTPVQAAVAHLDLPHGGVEAALGPNRGFRVQALLRSPLSQDAHIEFHADDRCIARARLADLREERQRFSAGSDLSQKFIATVNANPHWRMLDIGGRARSGRHLGDDFHVAAYTVLDILPGDNVDVVGDAHRLSDHFAPDSFDAILSVSVFEHLMMPWAVVPQMNRVLKTNGIALVATHQTIGMHDMPWDYWRFSDTAWDALFNRLTGFEIVERVLDQPQFVIPHIWRPDGMKSEDTAGYEISAVWVRKTGPCTLSWDAIPADLTATMYPTN